MDVRLTDSNPLRKAEEDEPGPQGAIRRQIKELASRSKRGKVGGVW
jgi:hypothetical protein